MTQLVAVGLADAVLTGNPTITFWRFVAKPYTNFALETQFLDFTSGQPGFGANPKCNLDRIGDLVYWMYIMIALPGIGFRADISGTSQGTADTWLEGCGEPYWTNAVGQAAIEKTVFFIGGQCIDELYSEFLYIWEELSQQPGKKLVEMTGNYLATHALQIASRQPRALYVPLPYWFTMNSGLALPIVSLQFHSVSVSVKFRQICDLIRLTPEGMELGSAAMQVTNVLNRPQHYNTYYAGTGSAQTGASSAVSLANNDLYAQVQVTYVYLDQRERSKFADGAFEQLIVEHQHTMNTITQTNWNNGADQCGVDSLQNFEINFNHAVIELFWVMRLGVHRSVCETTLTAGANSGQDASLASCINWQFNDWFNFSGPPDLVTKLPIDPVKRITLKLNNANRWVPIEGRYFRLVEPWQYHTNIVTATMVYSYSFALQPEDIQPSGTCNFSRIDNVKFEYVIDGRCFYTFSSVPVPSPVQCLRIADNCAVDFLVFCTNWNILRFKFGIAWFIAYFVVVCVQVSQFQCRRACVQITC